MTTDITSEQMAALAIRVTIDTIDAIAAVADPVRRAGQRAGRICKPILRQAFEQIDWQEVLRITILGLVITAVATYRFCRWAGPALVQASAALGRWYARLLVNHEPAGGDPQPQAAPQEPAPQPEPDQTPITPTPEPEPEPTSTASPAPATTSTRKPRRRTRRQPSTAA